MNLKSFLSAILAMCAGLTASAESYVVDQISLPVVAYAKGDDSMTALSPNGELVITVRYWDTFSNPDNNNYELQFMGYKDSSRSLDQCIFNSHLRGASERDAARGRWNGSKWKERMNDQEGIEQIFYLTLNNLWETRVALDAIGNIIVAYGRRNSDGQIGHTGRKFLAIGGGRSSWNKLVNFLRRAHARNIGQEI